MDTIVKIARRLKDVLLGVVGGTRSVPAPPKEKLHGRRGYGDNDIAPPRD